MSDKPTATPAPDSAAAAKPAVASTPEERAHAEKLLATPGKQPAKQDGKHGAGGDSKAHTAKPAGTKKKKKGKGKDGPSLVTRIKTHVQWARTQVVEIFKSLRSPDGPTRRMSLLFFISLVM